MCFCDKQQTLKVLLIQIVLFKLAQFVQVLNRFLQFLNMALTSKRLSLIGIQIWTD